jgi:hypothetical protein
MRETIMDRRRSILISGTVGLLGMGGERLANAVPTSPPSGYYYANRQEAMVASASVTLSDPGLLSDGYTNGTVQASSDGVAVTITSSNGYANVDYYITLPNRLSGGAPDPSWIQFDLKDQTGEFAGFNFSNSWTQDDGSIAYYFYQEVNGEGHSVSFATDAYGNVDESRVMLTKGRTKPDRCKIISDWGRLQCPKDMGPIREIPTQVRSFLTRIGWFDNAMSWTWDHVQRYGNDVGKFLGDPDVLAVLAVTAATAAAIACCISSSGTACAWCVAADLATLGGVTGAYYNSQNSVPTITNTSSQLRAAGIIACSGSGCAVQARCNYECPPSGCFSFCGYPSNGNACPAPWFALGDQCNMIVFQ